MINKMGIFGGSFEPFHNEHLKLANAAMEELGLDKLLVMPTCIPPHKKHHKIMPDEFRKEIINISLKGEKPELSLYEMEKGGASYTYQTIEEFEGQASVLYFIIGADMLVDFKTWKFPERILNACKLAVFNREGFYFDEQAERRYFKENFGKDFLMMNYVGKNLSATKIRVYSALGLDITPYVKEEVAEYIAENKPFYSEFSKYISYVKRAERPKRIEHTANVIVCALKKSRELKIPEDKIFLAALLHDCAKYLDKADFKGYRSPDGVKGEVEHAFLGAYVCKNILGIEDDEVIDAICYHTSGKANMTSLGKLIFTADMIEESRTYVGVERLRELYDLDFDKCFVECVKEEWEHLLATVDRKDIYSATEKCYRYYVLNENKIRKDR